MLATTLTVTNGDDSGAGSLRATIDAASAGDTIVFANGVTTVTLTTTQLVIAKNLTIQGSGVGGVTITRSSAGGTPNFRIVQVDGGVTATLTGLTISNGHADYGGGVLYLTSATVTLTDSVISGNTATESGGGLYNNRAALTVTNSTLSGNTATTSGGGLTNTGGQTTLTGSTVSANSAGFGGGIFTNSFSATLTLNGSTVSGNTAANGGGGLYNQETLTLTGSTVSGNTVTGGGGGGLYNQNGPLTLTNSTVSGNTATGNAGGGITVGNGTLTVTGGTISGNTTNDSGGGLATFNGTATLTNSTISGNGANSGGGGFVNDGATATLHAVTVTGNSTTTTGGGLRAATGSTTLAASIVAGNTATGGGADCQGTPTSGGYNVVGNGTGCPSNGPSDLAHSGALGVLLTTTLADNGGPTRTHALPTGSPAIDRVPTAQCGAATGADQRGTARPQGPDCDSGAFELAPPPAQTITVRSGADAGGTCPGADCTLRQALAVANAGDTIDFAPGVYEISLTTAQLDITRDVTIQGSGMGDVSIVRSNAPGTPDFRIVQVQAGVSATLRGLSIFTGASRARAGASGTAARWRWSTHTSSATPPWHPTATAGASPPPPARSRSPTASSRTTTRSTTAAASSS